MLLLAMMDLVTESQNKEQEDLKTKASKDWKTKTEDSNANAPKDWKDTKGKDDLNT